MNQKPDNNVGDIIVSWTDERVALLKKLWVEGKSAAEIAKTLGGGLTRNAVIGKAHRLKLSNRVSPIQQNTRKAPIVEKPIQEKLVTAKLANTSKKKVSGGVAMVNLKEYMCRWPEGDPKEPGFHFCGDEKIPGLPYCEMHARLAYQAPGKARTLVAEDFERDSGKTYDMDEELKEATA